jgi:hypothetical protein
LEQCYFFQVFILILFNIILLFYVLILKSILLLFMIDYMEALFILIDNEFLISFRHLLFKSDSAFFLRRELLFLQILYLEDEVLMICLDGLVLSSLALLVVSLDLINSSDLLNLFISLTSSLWFGLLSAVIIDFILC